MLASAPPLAGGAPSAAADCNAAVLMLAETIRAAQHAQNTQHEQMLRTQNTQHEQVLAEMRALVNVMAQAAPCARAPPPATPDSRQGTGTAPSPRGHAWEAASICDNHSSAHAAQPTELEVTTLGTPPPTLPPSPPPEPAAEAAPGGATGGSGALVVGEAEAEEGTRPAVRLG